MTAKVGDRRQCIIRARIIGKGQAEASLEQAVINFLMSRDKHTDLELTQQQLRFDSVLTVRSHKLALSFIHF